MSGIWTVRLIETDLTHAIGKVAVAQKLSGWQRAVALSCGLRLTAEALDDFHQYVEAWRWPDTGAAALQQLFAANLTADRIGNNCDQPMTRVAAMSTGREIARCVAQLRGELQVTRDLIREMIKTCEEV